MKKQTADLPVKTGVEDRIAEQLITAACFGLLGRFQTVIVCPAIKQKQAQDRKTHFKRVSLPVAKIRSPATRQMPIKLNQKTREGCGCPKFVAGRVFRQISTLLEKYSLIFRQLEMLSLPRFGHSPARKMAAGKSGPPSGMLLDFLLRDRHSLREFS